MMSTDDDFDATDLVPRFRREVHFSIRTVADVIFLGQFTIEVMIREWEAYLAEELNPAIEKADRDRKALGRNTEGQRFARRVRTLERLNRAKQATLSGIEVLKALKRRSEKKPAMPNLRPDDWFKEDDRVVCYIGEWDDRIVPDNFVMATVYDSYRVSDKHGWDDPFGGTVDVQFDTPIRRTRHPDELWKRTSYMVRYPKVLHRWEFEYLLAHPDFALIWAKGGNPGNIGTYAVEPLHFGFEQFLRALDEVARSESQ